LKKYYSIPFTFYFSVLAILIIILITIICTFIYKNYEYLIIVGVLVAFIPILLLIFKSVSLTYNNINEEFIYKKFFKKAKYSFNDIYKIKIEGLSVFCGLSYVYIFSKSQRLIKFDSSKKLIEVLLKHFSNIYEIEGKNIKNEMKKIKEKIIKE